MDELAIGVVPDDIQLSEGFGVAPAGEGTRRDDSHIEQVRYNKRQRFANGKAAADAAKLLGCALHIPTQAELDSAFPPARQAARRMYVDPDRLNRNDRPHRE